MRGKTGRDILKDFNQETLFQLAGFPVTTNKLVNPLRADSSDPKVRDNNPGCFYEWHNGILYFADFTGYFHKNNVTAVDVLKIITGLDDEKRLYYWVKNKIQKGDFENIEIPEEEVFEVKIEWESVPWGNQNYFSKYYIPKEVLVPEGVYKLSHYRCNTRRSELMIDNLIGNPLNTPIIAYKFGERTKLYNPYGEIKWFGNVTYSDIWGLETLDKTKGFVIVTKSAKDYLVIKYVLGYPCIALQSENQKKVLTILKDSFEDMKVYIIFDSDEVGIRNSTALSKETGWKNLILPQNKSNAKDTSDIILFHGVEYTKNLFYNFNISK